jgi:S-adenosylmethionine:diacylglycerol 3-amino-3-carboxypropyl transferase
MDTLLTLIIALGGIATGIGAIWTAMLARRQLIEQRRFLNEQNERARLTLEFDLLTRLEDRFQSPRFLGRRRSAARYAMEAFFAEDGTVQARVLDRASSDVANFFEEVGYFHRSGVLRTESVWHTFGLPTRVYWAVYGPSVRKMRRERNDPTVFEDFEQLDRVVADLSGERGMPPPTREQLLRIMKDETDLGQEPSLATE